MNFSELSLSAPLKSNLAKHGCGQPTPVQAQSIPPALAGCDLVATAQTGTGKTLAFVLPVIHRPWGAAVALRDPGGHPQPHTRTGTANPRDLRKDGGWHGYSRRRCRRRDQRAKATAVDPKRRASAHRHGRRFDFLGRKLIDLQGVFSWSWMRPIACWTWASCPRSGKSWQPCLRTGRHCSSRLPSDFRQTPGGDTCAQRGAYRSRFHD